MLSNTCAEISGLEFNNTCKWYSEIYKEIYHQNKNIQFYKFLNHNLIHNNFQYKLGLNVDIVPFNPSGMCESGGLYFCEEAMCHHHWRGYDGKKVAIIEIPDDARVYEDGNKFKADKLIITEIIDFCDMPDDFWINILHKDYKALEYVKNQTDELCTLAIMQNGSAIQFVKNQTKELCELAINKDGTSLQYVRDQTDELCRSVVQKEGFRIQYVKNPTDELCDLAVQQILKTSSYDVIERYADVLFKNRKYVR